MESKLSREKTGKKQEGFCNKCNMEEDGLRWERVRERWVERVF
jgi:hypothetical protein